MEENKDGQLNSQNEYLQGNEIDGEEASVENLQGEDNNTVTANPLPAPVAEDGSAQTESGVQKDAVAAENETVAPPPKKKKGKQIFWNVFLIVVIAVGILSLFGIVGEIDPESGASFGEVIAGASVPGFLMLLASILGVMILDVSKFCLISKAVTGKAKLSTCAKVNFIGKYYDAVTPFSTGGQPMQIYYLNSKGISGGNASAMVLIRYSASILAWIVLGGALMIYGAAAGILDNVSGGTLLKVTGWIGIAINLIIPTFVLLFLVLPKFMQKLTVGVVKLGAKLKIVKDVEKTTEKAIKVVYDFKTSFKHMATSPVKLILLILVSFGESALTFSTPFFVMSAFGCELNGMFITVMALNAFATFGVSFIPTPGNSGVVEGMGALAFSMAAGATLAWSVLAWRLSVFYLYIFIGIGITIFDVIMKNKKNKNIK